MEQLAVITGDIIDSRKIDAGIREDLYKGLDRFLGTLRPVYIEAYETYRGDSLQCEVKEPGLALRTALLIRSFMLAYPATIKAENAEERAVSKGYATTEFDIRLSIGIGAADFINREQITASDGEAFQLSGEGLDELREQQKLGLRMPEASKKAELTILTLLTDAIVQKWTINGAEFALHKLQGKKDEEIASLLGVSLSAVNQRKKTAQWHALEQAMNYFETRLSGK